MERAYRRIDQLRTEDADVAPATFDFTALVLHELVRYEPAFACPRVYTDEDGSVSLAWKSTLFYVFPTLESSLASETLSFPRGTRSASDIAQQLAGLPLQER